MIPAPAGGDAVRWVIVGVLVENAALSLVINLLAAWFIAWCAVLRYQMWRSLRPQPQPKPNHQDVLSVRGFHDWEGWG